MEDKSDRAIRDAELEKRKCAEESDLGKTIREMIWKHSTKNPLSERFE